jgi:diguanylate cyclase (GGDEF)-like protein
MASGKHRSATDMLGLVSAASMSALVCVLCFVAAGHPNVRQILMVVITGLGAGGLILFRQLRKAASSLVTSEARAQYVATHDELTQLPNKALFFERLKDAAQRLDVGGKAGPVGVLCVGVDRFEEVVEVLGPEAADRVVADVAARLTSICRVHDTVARVGDDSFAMLWSGATPARVQAVADQLIKLLSAPYDASTGLAFVTCSIGIGFFTSQFARPAEALRQAQMALSSARKQGGARVGVFEPTMDQALKRRKALEVDLRRALADDEMAMVYQPQVNAKGVMIGVEALMRWPNPSSGQVSPGVFVPLAESCGLSDTLGRFALHQAFYDAKRWPGLKVAINVSAAQVRSASLVPTLKTLLAKTGANARQFELEITEGVLLADEPDTYETLGAIRRMGFSLALDDFGTGYSSLSYLRRFPIDKVKIDRSFVSNLGMQPESDAIVKAIVELANALELKVIAEGVETRVQVDRLILAGCSQFQGFFYSRPIEAHAVDQMLNERVLLAA